jgi:hypothetical protein
MAGIAHQVARVARVADEVVEILDPVWHGALILGFVSLLWLALDRRPPLEIVQVYPTEAHPGEQVLLTAEVRRQNLRHCAADVSRYVVDGEGIRWDEPSKTVPAGAIHRLMERGPETLRIPLGIPLQAAPGYGQAVADIEYRCNITHAVIPIHAAMATPITILPQRFE